MDKDARYVELTTARTVIEAELLVGALKGLGITAVTFGGTLADEFSMSQAMMGLSGGVRVMVPADQLARAQRARSEITGDPSAS